MGLTEGRILWWLVRHFRPEITMETGFGRGGSAVFFLAASAPWGGRHTSIDPAFRHWAGDDGLLYVANLGLSSRHTVIEQPSEIALALRLASESAQTLHLSYIDGSHHFDGTLIDFVYFDRMTEVGGIIAIDDAHAPAVRTVASFVANNLPYHLHYATQRLVLCQKIANDKREWCDFKPFRSSEKTDWDMYDHLPDAATVPNATFSPELTGR